MLCLVQEHCWPKSPTIFWVQYSYYILMFLSPQYFWVLLHDSLVQTDVANSVFEDNLIFFLLATQVCFCFCVAFFLSFFPFSWMLRKLFFICLQRPVILLRHILVLMILHKLFFSKAWYALSVCKLNSFVFLESFQIYTLNVFFFFSWKFDFLLQDSYIHVVSSLSFWLSSRSQTYFINLYIFILLTLLNSLFSSIST